jgi:hypothetical protein
MMGRKAVEILEQETEHAPEPSFTESPLHLVLVVEDQKRDINAVLEGFSRHRHHVGSYAEGPKPNSMLSEWLCDGPFCSYPIYAQ